MKPEDLRTKQLSTGTPSSELQQPSVSFTHSLSLACLLIKYF